MIPRALLISMTWREKLANSVRLVSNYTKVVGSTFEKDFKMDYRLKHLEVDGNEPKKASQMSKRWSTIRTRVFIMKTLENTLRKSSCRWR